MKKNQPENELVCAHTLTQSVQIRYQTKWIVSKQQHKTEGKRIQTMNRVFRIDCL